MLAWSSLRAAGSAPAKNLMMKPPPDPRSFGLVRQAPEFLIWEHGPYGWQCHGGADSLQEARRLADGRPVRRRGQGPPPRQ